MKEQITTIGIDSPAYTERLRTHFHLMADQLALKPLRESVAGFFHGQLTTSDDVAAYRRSVNRRHDPIDGERSAYYADPETLYLHDSFFTDSERNHPDIIHDFIAVIAIGGAIINHKLQFNAGGSEFIGFSFNHCEFDQVDSVGTSYAKCNFKQCDLRGDFRHASFFQNNFKDCRFAGCDLTQALFEERSVFEHCDFTGAIGWEQLRIDPNVRFYHCTFPPQMEKDLRERKLADPITPDTLLLPRQSQPASITTLPGAASKAPPNPDDRRKIEQMITPDGNVTPLHRRR